MVDSLHPDQVRRPLIIEISMVHRTLHSTEELIHVMERASSMMARQLTVSASSVLVLHGLSEVLLK